MPKAVKPAKAAPSKKAVAEKHPLEGKAAPAFTLPDESGAPVALKELTAGGSVVLYFYPKDMTTGCTTEACSFRDTASALKAAGAQVVGVSADSSASHQKFIDKYDLNFKLLADPDNKVTKAYGVYKKKSLYGREYMGIERSTFIIDRTGVVRKVFPKVKVNGHTEEVLDALMELA
ncbi:MAG TPA: thioredoxin-dependent thiol peroxidase [Candidatus Binataceae bacterium]|nr:thioredoxin-dependent thiol peroxidase [Candidatus Binataceae bacterium]